MFFLMRACFWLGVVWLLLPVPDKDVQARALGDASATVRLVAATVGSAVDLCQRNPQACEAAMRGLVPADASRRIARPIVSQAPIALPPPRPTRLTAG